MIEVTKDNTGLILKMKDTGSFSQVYKFITLLENSPYELEFTSVNIHSLLKEDKNNTQKTIWEADLSIKLISFI